MDMCGFMLFRLKEHLNYNPIKTTHFRHNSFSFHFRLQNYNKKTTYASVYAIFLDFYAPITCDYRQ